MRKLSLLALMLLVLPIAQAADITSYTLDAAIDGDRVKESIAVLVDNFDSATSLTLLLPPSLSNLKASVNGELVVCTQREIFGGTEVTCPTPSTDYFLDIEFETAYPLVMVGERELFSQDFVFESTVGEFTFELTLPERAILPEDASLFLAPEPTQLSSDGRRIILVYSASDISEYEVSVIFEPPQRSPAILGALVVLVFLLLAAAPVAKVARRKLKRRAKKMEAKEEKPKKEIYLLPDEKDVLEKIKDSEGPIRQKDIETQVDFSKAKLSRVLRGLEERGLIKRIPKGNTNLIELLD